MDKSSFKSIDIKSFIKSDKGIKIIVALGIIGIVLILCSDLLFNKSDTAVQSTNNLTNMVSTDAYINNLEDKLASILSNIDGAGKVEVMITLVKGTENIYAYEEEKSSESSKETSETAQKASQQSELKQEYVLIDLDDTKSALVKTQIEPVVKGVIISCQGASKAVIKEMILDAVSTALDISINKVCVVTHTD